MKLQSLYKENQAQPQYTNASYILYSAVSIHCKIMAINLKYKKITLSLRIVGQTI